MAISPPIQHLRTLFLVRWKLFPVSFYHTNHQVRRRTYRHFIFGLFKKYGGFCTYSLNDKQKSMENGFYIFIDFHLLLKPGNKSTVLVQYFYFSSSDTKSFPDILMSDSLWFRMMIHYMSHSSFSQYDYYRLIKLNSNYSK